uniref:Ion_trans domain-containing protein n=1 Tax=Heterorhabditis bacteriophora TaxID=37862 RepID=A0A1I7WCK8_HETBA
MPQMQLMHLSSIGTTHVILLSVANHDNGEVKAERMHRIFRMFSSPSAQGPSLETVNSFFCRIIIFGLTPLWTEIRYFRAASAVHLWIAFVFLLIYVLISIYV